ncbi:MAG: hypothetical protein AAF481_19350, partial [Acidobacteriota bacterium]
AAALDAQWEELQQAKASLDDKRAELAAAREAAEAAMEEAAEEVEGEAAGAGNAAADTLAALETAVGEATDSFNEQLVNFINSDPPIEGEPRSERQNAAFAMKSDEDIMVAQEYIDDGGDYKRAINIYQQALMVDPDNERLQSLLAEAEGLRFMTEERFAQAKKGMTEDEVREALGPVNVRNVREYEDKGATAWFYPTAENGAAAAVWYRQQGGELKVYDLDFDFIKPQEEGA